MKKKLFILTGVLLVVSLVLSGCAAGLTASSWPSLTTDSTNAYIAGGPYVYAVNLETGVMAWRFPAKASAAPFYATPALTPDGKQLIVGGFDHKLYGLDVATGVSRWEFDNAHDRWIGGPLVTGDMIYAPNADYNLYALDLNGSLQWSFTADQSIWGTPASDGQRIYFGDSGHHVYALDAKSGQKAWEKNLDGAVLGSPAVAAGGLLYVNTYNGTVFALDPASGQVRWQFSASQWMWNGPTLDGTNVYVGDSAGMVYALDAAGGKPAWQQKMSGSVLGSPVLASGNLVVGTEAENVAFLDQSGTIVHTAAVSGKVYTTPAASGSLVLVALSNTVATAPILVAIDVSGTQKWSFIPPK